LPNPSSKKGGRSNLSRAHIIAITNERSFSDVNFISPESVFTVNHLLFVSPGALLLAASEPLHSCHHDWLASLGHRFQFLFTVWLTIGSGGSDSVKNALSRLPPAMHKSFSPFSIFFPLAFCTF
jgi:hypothetical protein